MIILILILYFIWVVTGEIDYLLASGWNDYSFYIYRYLDYFIDDFLFNCSQTDVLNSPQYYDAYNEGFGPDNYISTSNNDTNMPLNDVNVTLDNNIDNINTDNINTTDSTVNTDNINTTDSTVNINTVNTNIILNDNTNITLNDHNIITLNDDTNMPLNNVSVTLDNGTNITLNEEQIEELEFFSDFIKRVKIDRLEGHDEEADNIIDDILSKIKK